MKTEINILNNYWGLLNNLNPHIKLSLIEKLLKSLKRDINTKKNDFKKAFGAWESDESAEEIIAQIRASRVFKRNIEKY